MASTTAQSGTQSPPLEATGEQVPMGASSVSGAQKGNKEEVVSDSEQRKGYFKSDDNAGDGEKATGTQGIRTMGESMQDKVDSAT